MWPGLLTLKYNLHSHCNGVERDAIKEGGSKMQNLIDIDDLEMETATAGSGGTVIIEILFVIIFI